MGRAIVVLLVAAALGTAPAAGTPVQTPRVGGTAHFGLGAIEPTCLNVLLARCVTLPAALFVAGAVLEPAFVVGADSTFRPGLVSEATFTRKAPFVFTFRIDPRARWSDGVPITARDFVFTLRTRIARKAELYPEERELVELVQSVSAVSAKTVRVVLRSRSAAWRALFGNVLPRHALAGENLDSTWIDGIVNPKTGAPIGSGPFLIERWERGSRLTLVRNPRYWRSHPAYLDRLVVRFGMLAVEDLGAEYRRGDLDATWGLGRALALRDEPGIRLRAKPILSYQHFAIRVDRGGHPALRNKLVRRAIAYGIDRAAIAKVQPAAAFTERRGARQPRLPEAEPALPAELEDVSLSSCRGSQIARARRVSHWRGRHLRLFGRADVTPLRDQRRAGYGAHHARPGAAETGGDRGPAGVSLTRGFHPSGPAERRLRRRSLRVGNRPDVRRRGCVPLPGGQNYTGYCQRLVTRDLDQAERILDERERARALNRADAQMAKDVPAIPLYQPSFTWSHRTSLRNVVLFPNSPLAGTENWWLAGQG